MIQDFTVCNKEIARHIEQYCRLPDPVDEPDNSEQTKFSNTFISEQIRNIIPIKELRNSGIFFTGDTLSNEAANLLSPLSEDSRVLDPTCGAGNLLLSVLNRLPVRRTLTETLQGWGKILYGFDLHEEFIQSVKLRIILAAMQRVENIDETDIQELTSCLPNITVGDAYNAAATVNAMTHMVINPPFVKMKAPESVKWAGGHINSAAAFLEFCINNLKEGSRIVAILPEVLRAGSRYEKWRALIAANTKSMTISHCTRFDRKTDIDIFLFSASKNKNSHEIWIKERNTAGNILGTYFDVSIGPVVPYRDEPKGKSFPFLKPQNAPPWKTLECEDIAESRQYSGRVVRPPFIVIRRTSSPSDKFRATATIVRGNENIAVENHLIIVKPKSNKLSDCRDLLQTLKNPKTNDFLNKRIRCRHLTVSAVKEIPFSREKMNE